MELKRSDVSSLALIETVKGLKRVDVVKILQQTKAIYFIQTSRVRPP